MDRDADPQPYQFDESALELFVQELQEAGMVHCVNHGLFLQKSQEAGNVDA